MDILKQLMVQQLEQTSAAPDPLMSEERLLEELSWLLRGDEAPFVSGPIIEPTESFFPVELTPDIEGLSMLVDTLLVYAGLPDHASDIGTAETTFDVPNRIHTYAELAGIEDRVVYLSCTRIGSPGTALFHLTQTISLASWLVLQARSGESPYRRGRAEGMLTGSGSQDERYVASIHAFYRGLGLIALGGSHQYAQTRTPRGRYDSGMWEDLAYGELTPTAAAFLFAVQLTLRQIHGDALDALLAHLDEEHQLAVRERMKTLDRDALIEALALPLPEQWRAAE